MLSTVPHWAAFNYRCYSREMQTWMGHGYCFQGPLRVGSAQGETVASLDAIWNSWSHYKMAPQVYGSPFLLTVCGEACLGHTPLNCYGAELQDRRSHMYWWLRQEFQPAPIVAPWPSLELFAWLCYQQDLSSFETLQRLSSSWCPSIRNSSLLRKKSGTRNDTENVHLGDSHNGWLCVSLSEKISFTSDLYLPRDLTRDILSLKGWHYPDWYSGKEGKKCDKSVRECCPIFSPKCWIFRFSAASMWTGCISQILLG